ncbi:hypothetical protein, partial [Serratia marcescens]|uniref:hypothetical protein n=1 Tax=Serratia marcescens TaxID=615 RepID=UPI0019552621
KPQATRSANSGNVRGSPGEKAYNLELLSIIITKLYIYTVKHKQNANACNPQSPCGSRFAA